MNRLWRLSRRRLFSAALGAAGILAETGVVAECARSPGSKDPPAESLSSRDESMLSDDIADGIVIEDRGYAIFPVPDGNADRRIIGAAAVFRNTTDQPMRIHVRYRLVDEAGRGWHSREQNDWTAIVAAGWAYLPARQTVELGDIYQIEVDQADRVARIALYVIGEPTEPSVLLPVRVDELEPRPTPKDQWDYVSFNVDNPGSEFEEPNYGMAFRSDEGALIGGFFVDRANWADINSVLPRDESDQYPPGGSRHSLPTWLPAGIQPNKVTMYVWP